jgi:nucleoid DNA-binding protein
MRKIMNKTELVNNVAEAANITKVEAEKVVKSVPMNVGHSVG